MFAPKRIPKQLRRHLLGLAALMFMVGWGGQASAGLIWDFGVSPETNGLSGTGQVVFSGPSGPTPGVISSFSFVGTWNGILVDFDTPFTVQWSIDVSTWSINELLITSLGMTPGGHDIAFEINQGGTFGALDIIVGCLSSTIVSCEAETGAQIALVSAPQAFLTPVHEAPEPATVGLFLVGLLALVAVALWSARRRPSGAVSTAH